ncbi:MAG: hypothetical protein K0U52_10155 [Gammaproteobacteria bacterium]|nr:hypothetical protein [Gammaproteobacteria bacterium]
MNNYYNTNNETGSKLKESNQKAETQQEIILRMFKSKIRLTASDAWKIYDPNGITPITSIRRAITNLCDSGDLVKTAETKRGIYGKNEHVYKYVSTERDVWVNGKLKF